MGKVLRGEWYGGEQILKLGYLATWEFVIRKPNMP